MKRILLVCTGLLALTASPVLAGQIQLAWTDCLIDGGAAMRSNACTANTGTNRLAVSYTPPTGLTNFVAIDGTIDLQFDLGSPTPWWEFKNAGACRINAAGISISASSMPNWEGCEDTWDDGNGAIGLFTGYALAFGAPDRARAVFAIARPADQPTDIFGGTNYFGWIWTISNALTTSCTGCADPVAIFSPVMTLSGLTSGAESSNTIVLNATPNDGESCVSWNNGSCLATPNQSATWGKVKVLYR